MALSLRKSIRTRSRQGFVAHWLLLALLQQAIFATGTMAGSAADGGGWVTLCTASSDVAQLVYIGDSEQQSGHSQTEQCAFTGGVLATADIPGLQLLPDSSSASFYQTRNHRTNTPRHHKLARAPVAFKKERTNPGLYITMMHQTVDTIGL